MRTILSTPVLAGTLLILFSLGCSQDGTAPQTTRPRVPPPEPPLDLPSGPPPAPPNATRGFIWGHVLEASGLCIPDAAVEIVAGPGTGRKAIQTVPCDAWSYVSGFEFNDLPVDVTVRLRATKAGYRSQERETVAVTGGYAFQFVLVPE